MGSSFEDMVRRVVAGRISVPGLVRPRAKPWWQIVGALGEASDRGSGGPEDGFTLLELMIVITMILILMSIAIPRFEKSEQYAREAALKQDLSVMRHAIQDYTLDKQAAPQSLDDLVSAAYIGVIPTDPMTRAKDWSTETSDLLLSPEQISTGITDVHSSSPQSSPFDSTPYSSW